MKAIEVIVSASGAVQLETRGFAGVAGVEAARPLVAALGHPTAEHLTAEFHLASPDRPIPLQENSMFIRLKAWLSQSYPCRYCDGSGYESNLRMLWNYWRSWAFAALLAVIVAQRFWAAPAPVPPPLLRPAAPAGR